MHYFGASRSAEVSNEAASALSKHKAKKVSLTTFESRR